MIQLRSLIYIITYLCYMLLFFKPSSTDQLAHLTRSTGRALLSHDQPNVNTSLVATQDGIVHLVETNTKNVIWSFHSGPPIYSSYQAPIHRDDSPDPSNGFFIDIGDDWDLYVHAKFQGKIKLQLSIEDFIHSTPHISEDGSVLLGSKKTTVYEVEASTGKLIHVYNMSDSPSMFSSDEGKSVFNTSTSISTEGGPITADTANPRLYIMRTDYSLQSFAPNSNKVSWNITVAEVGVGLICQDGKNFLIGPPSLSKYDTISDYGQDFSMPLQCQSRAVVYRYRDHNSGPGRLPLASQDDRMHLTPGSTDLLPLQTKFDESSEVDDARKMLQKKSPKSVIHLQSEVDPNVVQPGSKPDTQKLRMNDVSLISFKWSTACSIILFLAIVVTFFINLFALASKRQNELTGHNGNNKTSKRKKNRKSGKNSGSAENKENHAMSSLEDGCTDNAMRLDLNKHIYGSIDGRQIGKLFVLDSEIAKGSNGTIILEGIYEGRPVAVKRLVRAHHEVAFKEIQHLIASDRHPNIVRWYGVEYDKDFVYLSLERCGCSLDDLIHIYSDSPRIQMVPEEQAKGLMFECNIKLDLMKKTFGDLHLWKVNEFPSPLIKLMRDIVSGLVHLHEIGIVHRDLKPQNVLIIKDTSICAKLSDMGISKQLAENMSSLGLHVTGCGSSGWQAPEQLLRGRQTRAVDMFSLGCVLFYCISGGRHPFGSHYERDANIVRNRIDLSLVEHIPEATDLFTELLNPDPEIRPKALEVLHHPLFWSYEMRLSFLRDVSDRVELEGRESDSVLLMALEGTAPEALGGKWDELMEPSFINNIGHYRRYKYDSVRDLLRVMRNKLNHYRELPKDIQELLGSPPEGYYEYFATRFPKLFIEVYTVVCRYCKEDECFYKYFKSNH